MVKIFLRLDPVTDFYYVSKIIDNGPQEMKENLDKHVVQNNISVTDDNNEFSTEDTQIRKRRKLSITSEASNVDIVSTSSNSQSLICEVADCSASFSSRINDGPPETKENLDKHVVQNNICVTDDNNDFSREDTQIRKRKKLSITSESSDVDIGSTSTKDRNFICEFTDCSASFNSRIALIGHIQLHSNKRQFGTAGTNKLPSTSNSKTSRVGLKKNNKLKNLRNKFAKLKGLRP